MNTAAQIDAWIASCYEALKQRVMMTCYFDEDVFQDTYLALRETGAQGGDFEGQFIKLYRALLSRDYSEDMRYCTPDPLFFDMLTEAPEAEEQETEQPDPLKQAQRVERTCKAILDDEDYRLFSLRWKIGLTFREIAIYTGRTAQVIMRRLNNIVKRIRAFLAPVCVPQIA